MIKNRVTQKMKYLIGVMIILTMMLQSLSLATSNVVDVTPPKGRIEIETLIVKDNTSYVGDKEITVNLYASDDICADEEIKYYLSTTKISNAEEIEESLWKTYSEGVSDTLTLPDTLNTVYAAFKDATGNTSVIYAGAEVEYTVTYNANDGSDAESSGTTVNYLADVVEIGDYVNYDVEYSNLDINDDAGDDYSSSLTGWRVISKEKNGTVNLVSAGVPLSFTYDNIDLDETIANDTVNGLTEDFLNFSFGESGFNSDLTLTEVFKQNKYTLLNGDVSVVRAMTSDDVTGVTGDNDIDNVTDLANEKYESLFAVGADYFLASINYYQPPYEEIFGLDYISKSGGLGVRTRGVKGIRVVVSLDSKVATTGKDENGAWTLTDLVPVPTADMPIGNNIASYHGMAFMITTQIPKLDNYSFVGWATSEDATVVSYLPGDIIPATTFSGGEKTINLYAIWSENAEKYIVKYNANGGELGDVPLQQEKYYNQVLTLDKNKPIREGYTFRGWTTSADSDTVRYSPGKIYDENANIELFAVWKLNEYTVTYNLNGGTAISKITGNEISSPSNQVMTHGETIMISEDLIAKKRHVFKGWATSKERASAGIVDYEPGAIYSTNESTTLYAVLISNLIPSIANSPVLGDGMNAVYWSDENATTELTANVFTEDMYNYSIGDGITDSKNAKWANAQTEDGSYWVWIPRFAYKITYYKYDRNTSYDKYKEVLLTQTAKSYYGDIDVLFMYGTSSTHYRDENGNPQLLPDGYIVHPAFQAMTTSEDLTRNPLGKWDSELEGIWVAKYQASREDSKDGIIWSETSDYYGGRNDLTTNAGNTSKTKIRMVSKPSRKIWIYEIYESTIYSNCEKMYPQLNSHQMKNSEWGAVAYLAHSPYGRNGYEVAINACSMPYTGAGKGEGYSSVYEHFGHYSYDESTFYTNYAWNKELGKLASTTGNIYGIYDMSGAGSENMASYIESEKEILTKYASSLKNSTIMRNKQVYMAAETTQETYEVNGNIYGDAIYEMVPEIEVRESWFEDSTGDFTNGICKRGGDAVGMEESGIFSSGFSTAERGAFRPVLCVTSND